MQKKEISSFSATYIIIGLLAILFLLYFIGVTMYSVRSQNDIFEEKKYENQRLVLKREELKKVKAIRSTPQYKDRFDKENFNLYQKGEIVFVLPPQEEESDEFAGLTAEQIAQELEKKSPIIEQWKNIFWQK